MKFNEWVKTDDLQYRKWLATGLYDLVEARYVEDGKYLICADQVNIADWLDSKCQYTPECIQIIESYYDSVKEFHRAYKKKDRLDVLAEMIFESTSHEEVLSLSIMVDEKDVESALENYMEMNNKLYITEEVKYRPSIRERIKNSILYTDFYKHEDLIAFCVDAEYLTEEDDESPDFNELVVVAEKTPLFEIMKVSGIKNPHRFLMETYTSGDSVEWFDQLRNLHKIVTVDFN